jgi:glutamate-1-semialdehyde 2,1-aminomutase
VACVVLEPATAIEPAEGFLHAVRDLCTAHGALLVFDEMITGFRWGLHGAQGLYGVTPDLSTFGKGMANGFSVSALVGRRGFMEHGGLRAPADRVFLLSTTHGAEAMGLAAALETMRVYRTEPVIETLHRQGERLRAGVMEAARSVGIDRHFTVEGRACNLIFVTRDAAGERSQAFRTLFMQEIIRRGVLGPSFVVSYSHTDDDVDRTVAAAEAALRVYRQALDDGVDRYLEGRPVKPVFRRRD